MRQRAAVLAAMVPFLVTGFSLGPSHSRAAGALHAQAQSGLPGTYVLVNIDGHLLPYAPVDPGRPADAPPPPTVVGSTLMVGDSTFQMTMSYRLTRQGAEQVVDRQFSGTYVREGTGYVFTWANAGQTAVTVRGDTLVMNNEGMLFAYRRQPSR